MSMIGVDLGASLVKIVFFPANPEEPLRFHHFRSIPTDITAYFNGPFATEIANGTKWAIGGAGSYKYSQFFGSLSFPPSRANEMESNARGVSWLLKHSKVHTFGGTGTISDRYIIASMGSGVSFTLNTPDVSGRHIGGSAVGGGTLMALAKLILGITDYGELLALAASGNQAKVDLMISDIVGEDYGDTLKAGIVASSLAKAAWEERPEDKDLAAALVATVTLSIGTHLAALCTAERVDTVVFVGGLLDVGGIVPDFLQKSVGMWHPEVTVVVPEHHMHAGAIGAALSLKE
jgi:type II pantothenate kinase